MKGDFHVRFCEKFEVKFLLLTRLRGRELITPSYSITRAPRGKLSARLTGARRTSRGRRLFPTRLHTDAQMKLLGTYVLGLAESEDQDENGI